MVGDPHIETLDEILYTFNGLGEYIQVKFPDVSGGNVFELQGRTARAMDTVTQQLTDATVFVAFVAKAKDAQTVIMFTFVVHGQFPLIRVYFWFIADQYPHLVYPNIYTR